MSKPIIATLLLAVALVVSVSAIFGYERSLNSEKAIVRGEACFAYYDKDQLVNHATAIVSGEVVASEVQDDLRGFPATDYLIKVDKIFKGNPGAEVEVRTEGGENAKMKYIPGEGFVTFQVGEKVLLFLTDDKGERTDREDFGYYVVGGPQGKFKEEDGKLKSRDYAFNVATFEQELEQIEKDNKAKGLKKLKAEPGSDGI